MPGERGNDLCRCCILHSSRGARAIFSLCAMADNRDCAHTRARGHLDSSVTPTRFAALQEMHTGCMDGGPMPIRLSIHSMRCGGLPFPSSHRNGCEYKTKAPTRSHVSSKCQNRVQPATLFILVRHISTSNEMNTKILENVSSDFTSRIGNNRKVSFSCGFGAFPRLPTELNGPFHTNPLPSWLCHGTGLRGTTRRVC